MGWLCEKGGEGRGFVEFLIMEPCECRSSSQRCGRSSNGIVPVSDQRTAPRLRGWVLSCMFAGELHSVPSVTNVILMLFGASDWAHYIETCEAIHINVSRLPWPAIQ